MKKNKKSVTLYAGSGVYLAMILRELGFEIPDYAILPLTCIILVPAFAVGITYFFLRLVDKYNQTRKYRHLAKIVAPLICAILIMEFGFDSVSKIIFPLESFLVSLFYLKEYEKITHTLPKPRDFKKPMAIAEYQDWLNKKVKFLLWGSTVGKNYLIVMAIISTLLFLDNPKDLGWVFSVILSMSFINISHFFISTNKKK